MMTGRLINADELIKNLSKWMKEVDPTHPSEIPPLDDMIVSTIMTVEEEPTVDAISVEWLKKKYPLHGVAGTEMYFRKAHAVEDILKDWEQEKKIDKAPTVEAPQWIPVSERLPNFGVDVLVCNDEGVQVTAKRTGWSTDPNCWAINYCGYDYDSWNFMTNGDIVAWMELPKPYERKEE